jgi:transcriptional regulator with XRE-family HTH domain
MTIGEKIIKLRYEHDWSQGQLAFKSGVKQQHISGYERGLYEPSVQNCIALANVFDVTLDELCCRYERGV